MERKFNLKPRKASHKDYSHAKSVNLGAEPLKDELLFLTPILNQNDAGVANDCTAYSAVAARASETGKVYDPQEFWKAEVEMGATEQGTDLQTALACGVSKGFVTVPSVERTDKPAAYFWIT